jgi:hypothetical protein
MSWYTPNKFVPLNDREKGEIAPIALDQLKKYQEVAESWGVYPDDRCRRCMECDENIWFACDQNYQEYLYTDGEILALKVAHIRQCHDDWIKNG